MQISFAETLIDACTSTVQNIIQQQNNTMNLHEFTMVQDGSIIFNSHSCDIGCEQLNL